MAMARNSQPASLDWPRLFRFATPPARDAALVIVHGADDCPPLADYADPKRVYSILTWAAGIQYVRRHYASPAYAQDQQDLRELQAVLRRVLERYNEPFSPAAYRAALEHVTWELASGPGIAPAIDAEWAITGRWELAPDGTPKPRAPKRGTRRKPHYTAARDALLRADVKPEDAPALLRAVGIPIRA